MQKIKRSDIKDLPAEELRALLRLDEVYEHRWDQRAKLPDAEEMMISINAGDLFIGTLEEYESCFMCLLSDASRAMEMVYSSLEEIFGEPVELRVHYVVN